MNEEIKLEVETTLKVTVNPLWLEWVLGSSDFFLTDYCGYWAHGVERSDDPDLGWLLWDHGADENYPSERLAAKAIDAWKAGEKLPNPKFHVLNKAVLTEAYKYGVKRWGEDWFETGDALDMDAAIQMALLGEIVYG